MDFSYPDTHIEIRELAGTILGDLTTSDRLKVQEKNGAYLDNDIWRQLMVSGIHTASFPENLYGMDMDYMASALVAECIGQSVASIPFIPCIVSAALPLLSKVDDPVVYTLLEAVAEGKKLVTTALIEPGNENPFMPSATALVHNGNWYVSGTKHCVPYARESQSVLLFARKGKELWAGIVNLDGSGSMVTEQHCTTQEPQYMLTMEQAVAHSLGQGEAAEKLLKAVVAMTTVAYCSMAVGIAEKMTRIAADYTSQREQFGVPVATFQAVAHRLASCYIDTECLRIMTQQAASDVSRGLYDSDSIAMAKVWCGDVMHRVSQAAQHVHGGTGIDRDYPLFRYCLWAKHLELVLGNSRVHLANLADKLAVRYLASATS
ncbi:MAG TPA: acyl-CoA dehydrogenase family protein [Pseudomonadales bacterium]|nr:acyl-CoA dehydrogenase family protein [Pseudomonadales bacterium]